MQPTLEDGLRVLRDATERAKSIRIELDDDYLANIARVEAHPDNQSGADKSWVFRLDRAFREMFTIAKDLGPSQGERRTFEVDNVEIPVARLLHIVTSKHAAGRDKDILFLATHRDALEQLLKREDGVS